MHKAYETTVCTDEIIGSVGLWHLKGNSEERPLIVPSSLEAIPDNTTEEGIQGKIQSLCVEKTEIKVLEVLEFSEQSPGEEEAMHKKEIKTNKQKTHHKDPFESLDEFRSTQAQGWKVHRLCKEQLSE